MIKVLSQALEDYTLVYDDMNDVQRRAFFIRVLKLYLEA